MTECIAEFIVNHEETNAVLVFVDLDCLCQEGVEVEMVVVNEKHVVIYVLCHT